MNLAAFQEAVVKWLKSTFTPDIVLDRIERGDRLLEETLELLQSGDYPRDRVITILDYTYSRPKGEPMQELGGTLVTLAAYSNAHYLHMEIAGVNELLRCWDKQEVIREKQKEKPKGSPAPTFTSQYQALQNLAFAAKRFCEELDESSSGVPKAELDELHFRLDEAGY